MDRAHSMAAGHRILAGHFGRLHALVNCLSTAAHATCPTLDGMKGRQGRTAGDRGSEKGKLLPGSGTSNQRMFISAAQPGRHQHLTMRATQPIRLANGAGLWRQGTNIVVAAEVEQGSPCGPPSSYQLHAA